MSFLPGWFPQVSSPPNPRMRLVGVYDLAFGGAASKTVTVPAIDLVFPASPTKQILVIVPGQTQIVSNCTINGATAALICTAGRFIDCFSAVYAGAGPFNIVVTNAATSSDDEAIAVFEVDEAAPLYQGARSYNARTSTTLPMPLRVPDRGLCVASLMSLVDTVTSTWTGVTEIFDQDAGNVAFSGAANLSPASGNSSVAVLDTTASADLHGLALTIAPNKVLLQGGSRHESSALTSGISASFSTLTDFTGMGNFRLIALIAYQIDNTITGVTYNGNAMTLIGQAINTTPVDVAVYAYYIDVTQAAPTGNIVVTFSGGTFGDSVSLTKCMVYNVGSIGDVQTGTSAVAAGAALQVDVNEGGMLLGIHAHDTTTDTITWSGIDANFDVNTGTIRRCVGQRPYCAAEVNRAVQATASGAAANATIVFALNP